jgi:hypothetical protein
MQAASARACPADAARKALPGLIEAEADGVMVVVSLVRRAEEVYPKPLAGTKAKYAEFSVPALLTTKSTSNLDTIPPFPSAKGPDTSGPLQGSRNSRA